MNIEHHSAQPLSHTDDPATSYEAADRMVKSRKLERQEQEEWVLSHIDFYCLSKYTNEFTAKEVANFINPETKHFYYILQRHLSGLRNKGKIERIQKTVTTLGKTYKVCISKSGKPVWVRRNGCCVWRLTMKAKTQETILEEIEKLR